MDLSVQMRKRASRDKVMNRSNDATRRPRLMVASALLLALSLSLALSCRVDFAQESRRPTNDHKSPATKETPAVPPAKNWDTSTQEQNEPSSDELESNTPMELRKLKRCVIEEIVTITPDGIGVAPFAVAFDGSSSVAPCGKLIKWIWSFGDGTKARGAKVTHTYAAPGEYTVKLELTDSKGNRNLVDMDYVVTVTAENMSTERLLRKTEKPTRRTTQRRRTVGSVRQDRRAISAYLTYK